MTTPQLNLILKLTDNATAGLKSAGQQFKDFGAQVTKVGVAMAAAGAAITGALAMTIKAAGDEEAGIMRLSQALRNVGVSYDDVKDSLEDLIAVTQRKTAVSDGEQRDALAQIVALTGDYNTALDLLPTALDLAAGAQMDLSSAAMLVGRVAQGNTEILSRYGLSLGEGATATEALAAIQAKYAGQAEAYGNSTAGAIASIKNAFDDLSEVIGNSLLPTIRPMLSTLTNLLEALQKTNPVMLENITVTALAAGAFLALSGAMLMAAGQIPSIIAGLTTMIPLLGITTGELGLAVLAGAAFAAILYMIQWNIGKLLGYYETSNPFEQLKADIQGATGALMEFSNEMMGLETIEGGGFQVKAAKPKQYAMLPEAEQANYEAAIAAGRFGATSTPYAESPAALALLANAKARQEQSAADIVNASNLINQSVNEVAKIMKLQSDAVNAGLADMVATEKDVAKGVYATVDAINAQRKDVFDPATGEYMTQEEARRRARMRYETGVNNRGQPEWLTEHLVANALARGKVPKDLKDLEEFDIPPYKSNAGQSSNINITLNIDGKPVAKAISPYLGDSYRQRERIK